MIIYQFLLYLYLANAAVTIIHELGHAIIAKIIKIDKIKIEIGEDLLSLNFKIVKISPIIFSGSVACEKEKIISKKKHQIILLFLGGIISSLITLIIGICLYNNHLFFKCLTLTSGISILISSMPLSFLKTDISEMIKLLNEKRNLSKI